ncbi:MAG: tRNA 2-thiouridine(34) synthase MnmA [Clostridia bacterium]|nr:tRNA 2-thiouridine(34) synthase MnmA [Clostridia bacterium]
MKKIVVGMSGGVDSNIAVKRLLDEGYDVIGVTLVMSDETDTSAAAHYAERLGIEHKIVDCREDFDKFVITDFVNEYVNGRTPNPCVECNRYVKFRRLCDVAAELGADYVSTGHYVDVRNENGRLYIVKAQDRSKDQSYVLWQLTQDELKYLMFPLASDNKKNVMALARENELVPERYDESQEICFIPSNDHAEYIERRNGKKWPAGYFKDENGKILGFHNGIIRYTVGQRKGIGISFGVPMFVKKINATTNTVVLSDRDVFTSTLVCDHLNFQKLPEGEYDALRLSVKVRYSAPCSCVTVSVRNGVATALFDSPIRAVTPGQSAVFYDGDGVAFGGKIISE